MGDYISVSEAAKQLRCTRQEIVRKIWRGFIKAEKVGRAYIIKREVIDKMKKTKGSK